MSSVRNIAIIPARAGSKRLPGKNSLEFLGKPLVEHSMDFALENMDVINEIMVTTDDEAIKAIATQKGVKVLDRPKQLAGDHVSTVEVLKHALESTEVNYDNVILLQATNPLRPENLLKTAYEDYIKGNHDSLMTVTRNHQKFGKISDGQFKPFNYRMGQRSQDLEPLYFENGLLYITKAELIKKGMMLGENNLPFIVDHPFAHVDIDTRYDLDMATFIANQVQKDTKVNE